MVQRKAQDGKPRTAISILTQLLNYDEMFYENSAFYSCDVRVAWYHMLLASEDIKQKQNERGISRGLSTLVTQLNAGMQRR